MSESESDVNFTFNLFKIREKEQAKTIRLWNSTRLFFSKSKTSVSINNKTLKNELLETIFISTITSIFESSIKSIELSKSSAVITLFISIETSKSKNRVFISIDELISFFKQSKQSQLRISRRTSTLMKLSLELSLQQLNNFKNNNTSRSFVVIDHQEKMSSKTIQIFDFHEYFSKNSSRWFRLIEIQHVAQM